MRSLAIAVLCGLLGIVFWLGARVFSENVEMDISTRTQQEIIKHRPEIENITRVVDGRDVKIFGKTNSETARSTAGEATENVWGVRVLENHISVEEKTYQDPNLFSLNAEHVFPNLKVSGRVGEPAYDTITNIHRALPPESTVDHSELENDASELLRGPRVVETGIAAVTQLNPGRLTITDKQFILEGTVNSHDRKKTVEQLIDVRRAELEHLEIIVDIVVEAPGITQACSDSLQQILANNVINYAVDHYAILDEHSAVLSPMVDTILGVCSGQISSILVEGHADYTGGAGYNQGLSERRSGTVQDYLIEHNVDPQLISAFGYGEFRPIASNETVEGRAMNRRTEIYLLIQDQISGESLPEISLIKE